MPYVSMELEQEAPCGLVPWVESPFALFTWWDMEKFAASQFCVLCANLNALGANYSKRPEARLLFQERQDLVGHLNSMTEKCQTIGLEVAALQMEAFRDALVSQELSHLQVSQMLAGLGQAVVSEMSTHLFLRIPKEKVKFYEQPQLFGERVADNFTSAERDIRDAGSCYAENKNTACVMHLMRVLELGLTALANKLGVTIRKPDWENIINDVEAAIKKIDGPHAGANWKAERDFYSGAAKDFRYFKNAWRNHAMHVHEHYDESEARSIIDHIKSFMVHLAESGLKE